MSNEDLIICISARVGTKYELVVSNINSMPETLPLSEVYGMLLSQETRTVQNFSTESFEANFTQMRNRRRYRGNGEMFGNQQQPRIVFRNSGGGSRNGGTITGQGNQNSQDKGKGKVAADNEGSESKGPCPICFKIGYLVADCWHRQEKTYVPQPNRRRRAYMTTIEGQSNGALYLDSGATNHVTNTIGNMSLNLEYQGNNKLTIGNGEKLLISHICYSILSTSDPHKHIKLNYILCVPNITQKYYQCF